ncbi:MAG: ATP-dependent helicase [Lachnospiraceae bacterium]|nr:ATP-dependent helicase [Lachnospiraceae bacterium]
MGKELSGEQFAAIRHDTGPALVMAGPGSGKTTVITERIKHLVRINGVDPGGILTITFTNAAADEMKKRTADLIPQEAPYLTFGTFHSIFFLILKHSFDLNSSNILKNETRYMILNDIIKTSGICVNDRKQLTADLVPVISRYKNTGRVKNDTELKDDELIHIMDSYRSKLDKMRLLDFDDMLLKCRELFMERKAVLSMWQDRFKYIQIDEFQDINDVQYDVIRLLSEKNGNLFAVGDDDQAIYGFRGSTPGIMKRFVSDFEGTVVYTLSANYRSSGNIVEAAKNVISYNCDRMEKDICSRNPMQGEVKILKFKDMETQIAFITEKLREESAKTCFEDMAVLLRTNNLFGIYSDRFRDSGIPFNSPVKTYGMYQNGIGKEIMDYMKFAAGDDSRAVFLNIMNRPERHIYRGALGEGKVDLDGLLDYYSDDREVYDEIRRLKADRAMMKKLKPYAAIHYLFNSVGYLDYLKGSCEGNNGDLSSKIKTAEEILNRARAYRSIDEWLKYAKEDAKKPSDNKGVNILTMHASKGLEFPVVFIPDMNEGNIPYGKAVMPAETEEERRLFYVAMTRAKRKLYLLYTEENSGKKRLPSRFLEEISAIDTIWRE